MTAKRFDPCMIDRHPAVQIVVGQTQSGKTTYCNLLASLWPGHSLAIDGVCSDPPEPRHLAHWTDAWCEPDDLEDAEPGIIPAEVSLVLCDEASLVMSPSKRKFQAIRQLLMRGQHTGRYKTSLVLATQRPSELSLRAFSQAKRVVIFRTKGGGEDYERLRKLPGMTAEALRIIPELPTGYCVVWDVDEGLRYPWVPDWQR